MSHHLFGCFTREPDHLGNTEWLARQAAAALPAGVSRTWCTWRRCRCHRLLTGAIPLAPIPCRGRLAYLAGCHDGLYGSGACVAGVLVLVSVQPEDLLDHWSAWLRVPGLGFRMPWHRSGCTSSPPAGTAPRHSQCSTRRGCAHSSSVCLMPARLWGQGAAGRGARADAAAIAQAEAFSNCPLTGCASVGKIAVVPSLCSHGPVRSSTEPSVEPLQGNSCQSRTNESNGASG